MTFLSNIPPFVYPLFAILLIIGIKSTRARQVPVYVFYLLPFLGLLAIRATASLNVDAVSWGLFGLAYVVAVFAGRALQNRFILGTEGGKLKLKGEYATLVMLMGIFALNFVKGAATGMAPELATSGTFADAFALFGGAFAGLFLGRAWAAITAAIRAANSAAQTETDTQPPFAKREITSQRF